MLAGTGLLCQSENHLLWMSSFTTASVSGEIRKRSPQPSRRVKITTLLLSKQVLPSSKSGIMLLKEKCLFFGLWNLKPGKCKKIIGSSSIDVKVKVTQSCPTLCDLMDCNLSRSSFHGILHWTWVSCTADRFFTIWATRKLLTECCKDLR